MSEFNQQPNSSESSQPQGIQQNYPEGQVPYQPSQAPYAQGQPYYAPAQAPYTQGQPPYTKAQAPYAQGQMPYAPGQGGQTRYNVPYMTGTYQQKPPKKKLSFLWGFLLGIVLSGLVTLGLYAVAMPAGLTALKEGGLSYKQAQELVNKVDQLMRTIDQRYILGDPTTDELLDGAYHGMVNSLGDPYSAYYNYDELNSFVQSGNGEYVGIGVTVQLNPDATVGGALVVSVNQSGGAYEQGIQVDDILIGADGVSFKDMTLNEMVELMRGPEGTEVEVTYLRKGAEETVTIARRKLTMIEVNYTMMENNIGYIAITEFDAVASTQFREAVDTLLNEGMEKLVIDLRDNPGGRVDVVCDIVNRIITANIITYMIDKDGESSEYYADSRESLDLPMVVLVNGNSASASELMTGALKDYEVATVIGTTTFGKGIVQTTIPYADGTAIKVTTAKYYTPLGVNIHGTGIEPDIVVELPEDVTFASLKDKDGIPDIERDTQLQKALEVLNAQ